MNIEAIYPKPNTSTASKADYKYPYLLKDLAIIRPNHVWATDITYIKMPRGFVYLCALIDIYSRFIVSWKLSITLETQPCIDMLEGALLTAVPQILNSDQGSQFTSDAWISTLKKHNIAVSMDGKGRCLDNVYIERFWRSLKQEKVYLVPFDSVLEAKKHIDHYMHFYNFERPHQSLNYKTPAALYKEKVFL